MATTIEALAADTLMTAIGTAFSATYAIAYPDIDFKPTGSAYFDVAILPNGAAFEPMSGNGTHQGLLQVAVMYPKGGGVIDPLALAGEVVDVFDKGARFIGAGHSVKISTRPVIAQPIPDGAYVRVPVTISYQATKD